MTLDPSARRIVDLSRPLSEELPVEIGRIRFHRDFEYAQRGFSSHWIEIHTHNGTHVDAPLHTEPGGAPIDALDPGRLYGPGVLLDLTPFTAADHAFTRSEVEAAEAEVDGGIRPGEFVILRSDWSTRYGTDQYWQHSPFLSADAARLLVMDRAVRGLGYDFSQEGGARDHAALQERIDQGLTAPGDDLVIHHIVLGHGLYQVECLTNVAAIRSQRFDIVVAPLALVGLEAAPARVFVLE